jgi:hypothetical protein
MWHDNTFTATGWNCAVVLWDTFEVMLLPVPVKRSVRLVMLFLRFWWAFWSAGAHIWKPGPRRERIFGLFGPMSLVCLILTWLSGLIAGFSLIQLSLIQPRVGFLQALFLSGNTFFTLGIGSEILAHASATKAVSILEAGCGLGFLALVIGYLPVLYQLYARRETHVMLLDERAGSPPSALTLLERHTHGQSLEELGVLLREWERWSAELLESHMSYPMLSYYRSPFVNQSWLTATCAVLDTCVPILVGLSGIKTFQARMSFAVTRLAIAELMDLLGVPQVALGAVRLPSDDFAKLSSALDQAGLSFVEPDAELRLAKFRATYEPFLGGLAKHLMLPLAAWVPQEEAQRLDNWMNNSRGRIARQLIEEVDAEPRMKRNPWNVFKQRGQNRKGLRIGRKLHGKPNS